MMLDKVPYEEIEDGSEEKPQTYDKIGGIGTELQVIESVGEVSSNSRQNSQ
jgi:hypothetical protein